MRISIIIPTYNEEDGIGKLVNYLQQNSGSTIAEIIISDRGSGDNTLTEAKNNGALAVLSPKKGRAAQMNYGALLATGDILYFVHADVLPPKDFIADIIKAVKDGFDFGRYTMRFNTTKWYLRVNEFFTKFDFFMCYGGDQTLFVTKQLFNTAGGFNEEMSIMEDFEFTKRLKEIGRYKIFRKAALVSDRKYDNNSWWVVQKANYTIVRMYKRNATQDEMIKKYKEMLDYR